MTLKKKVSFNTVAYMTLHTNTVTELLRCGHKIAYFYSSDQKEPLSHSLQLKSNFRRNCQTILNKGRR